MRSLKMTEERTSFQGRGFRKRPSAKRKTSIMKAVPIPEGEEMVDIFNEDYYVFTIIDFPGLNEKSIKVNLEKDKLAIIADKAGKNIAKK